MLILGIKANAKLWGGERLHDYGADKNMTGIGQTFSMSATKEFDCDIIGGEYKGQTLRKVYHDQYERFGYDKYDRDTFPLMVDLVDAINGDLSIQVHPIDSYAQENMGMPFGKTESWFYMIPPETGEIYCGCKVDTIEEVKQKSKKKNGMNWSTRSKCPKTAMSTLKQDACTLLQKAACSMRSNRQMTPLTVSTTLTVWTKTARNVLCSLKKL